MCVETLDCTVNRARAAAENVPWSAMRDEGGELADVHRAAERGRDGHL